MNEMSPISVSFVSNDPVNTPPVFKPLVSHSGDNDGLQGNQSSDTEEGSGSMVIHADSGEHQYAGVPIMSDELTPVQRPQHMDPNEMPLPPLRPLPAPPSPKINKSQSLPPDENETHMHVAHIRAQASEQLHLTPTADEHELYDDERGHSQAKQRMNARNHSHNKRKKTHKRTGSLRDSIKGLVKSASLRKLHRRTQSGVVFNDVDSPGSSDEEKDEDIEDSFVTLYRALSDAQLEQKRRELIAMYREIAYRLWDKYVRVGSEYEINIDYGLRKRFGVLMRNKQEWLHNESFDEKELFLLFHPCVTRMFTFLSHSFTRFRDKPDFDRVQDVILI